MSALRSGTSFVESHLGKLHVMLRSRVLRDVQSVMCRNCYLAPCDCSQYIGQELPRECSHQSTTRLPSHSFWRLHQHQFYFVVFFSNVDFYCARALCQNNWNNHFQQPFANEQSSTASGELSLCISTMSRNG